MYTIKITLIKSTDFIDLLNSFFGPHVVYDSYHKHRVQQASALLTNNIKDAASSTF